MNVRSAAASVIYQVVDKGVSLSTVLPEFQQRIKTRDHALLQEICFGVLRHLPQLEGIVRQLMDKPLKGKQRVFHHLLLVGIYQIKMMRIPDHAAVGETVNATLDLKGPKLRGLINAVLRNYQRRQEELESRLSESESVQYCHPGWFIRVIKESYPEHWQDIFAANNNKAPMWLRVNRSVHSRDEYIQLLKDSNIDVHLHSEAEDAIKLAAPCDVSSLPGFSQGWVSVQDAAAQLSVRYLNPKAKELILDCCAAPGGKTAHILEHVPDARVVSVDNDESRLKRVYENLNRLNIQAEVICGDARYPQKWWQGETFDRILLDAPCSATGVIRRHPDIKWLRRLEDIDALATIQSDILDAMWAQLKPGGTMVYATCSIMPQENSEQIKAFISRTTDVQLVDSEAENPGRQILPGEEDMDGFYYAVLRKHGKK
ncbi:Ribosomal RNA small subunit methyltransferase B [Vibrio aerogenes CECT 7868]|uniref:Ribosomal RNA small subunit methyltransferase B n=1 Tax=Vibrio aerogenes CECT 7868 TaxID=1216006 RepID=A0A1M6EQH5_9VIBR|nr:16S rRNA (cytosine(967)-C(5))-methyltransferase RsmB [Vibrio aerogenes]SHI87695.1 Ribosomal RNA small subunit methyltransferase B [Vibrio aerogenes CECT 7868]